MTLYPNDGALSAKLTELLLASSTQASSGEQQDADTARLEQELNEIEVLLDQLEACLMKLLHQ